MNMNQMRRFLAKVLAFMVLFTAIPLEGIDLKASFADLSLNSDGALIKKIAFIKKHNGFDVTDVFIEIQGEKLKGIPVLFKENSIYNQLGVRTFDTDNFIQYKFSAADAVRLSGDMLVGGKPVTVGLSDFPVLTSLDKKSINLDDYTSTVPVPNNEKLVLSGTNFSSIETTPGEAGKVKAQFGKSQGKPFYYDAGSDNSTTVTLERPTPPDANGLQFILFTRKAGDASVVGGYETEITYRYDNAFRFVTNVGLQNLEMSPNTGVKGDTVNFDADVFNDTLTYGVYFLKALDGSDDYRADNKAEFVAINKDVDPATKDRLIVKVPNNANFTEQEYFVVITTLLNGEVVAEQVVKKPGGEPDKFNVIQSAYKPSITRVYPGSGPDKGADTTISGLNLVSPNLPDVTGTSPQSTDTITSDDGGVTLKVAYGAGYNYKGAPATITREIKGQIGKPITFKEDGGAYVVTKSATDSLWVRTGIIDDALTDPLKDVILEITTRIVAGGKTYTFVQLATLKDGFKFVPSSATPEIEKITPDKFHVEPVSGMEKLKNETIIRIKGKNFLVHRTTDANNNVYTRYPSIFFKTVDNTNTGQFQLAFLPNALADPSNLNSQRGIIQYVEGGVKKTLITPFEITVLDGNGAVVNGTEGNDMGTTIVLRMPNTTVIETLGIKNVQVTNPLRSGDEFGDSTLKNGAVSFVRSTNAMTITSVDPNVWSVEGGQKVVLKGNNIDDGVRLFVDGEEIKTFTTEPDPSGQGSIMEFTSPKGREGVTQVLLLNEDGYTAVANITYVKTFKEGPVITKFVPTSGTPGTLVTVAGKNFLKPDPTVTTLKGLDAYRLLGTRLYFDGKDVNTYNKVNGEITFLPYTAPAPQPLVTTVGTLTKYGKYKDNAVVASSDDKQIFTMEYDSAGNVRFTNRAGAEYTIKPSGASFAAYDNAGVLIGPVNVSDSTTGMINTQTFLITPANGSPQVTVVATTDNNPVHYSYNASGKRVATTSNYAQSIILTDGTSYFTLNENLDGTVTLSNGKDTTFNIVYDANTQSYKAEKENTAAQTVFFKPGAINIGGASGVGGVDYSYLTAYTKDTDGMIVGDVTKVITSGLMSFIVPRVTTGNGYKDLKVINPDTQKDEKTGNAGFLYVNNSTSKPLITEISPFKGSHDGGYNVRISGKDFRTGMKVFFGSAEVPSKDIFLAPDGSYVTVRVPKSELSLVDFKINAFKVPVEVLNPDGGSDHRDPGFTYILPDSNPFIDRINPATGSANGGTIVEIYGREFRFYEPYTDMPGGTSGYDVGIDTFVDLNRNGVWDNYNDPSNPAPKTTDPNIKIFGYYYNSEVFPKVYFGEKEGKIVEYSGDGYIKVIAPPHASGAVETFVVNNDYGVSNKVTYTYKASTPKMTTIVPNKGRRTGQELKEINGTDLYPSKINGYYSPAVATLPTTIGSAYIKEIPDVTALMKFYNIDNVSIPRDEANSGMINNGLTSVTLTGGLTIDYRGAQDTLNVTLEENGKVYTRTFENYDDSTMFLPMEMLMTDANSDGTKDTFYTPFGFTDHNGSTYSNRVYEYVKVYIVDGMLKVERGYAPKATYDNKTHVQVMTPSYYTIDPVNVTYYNDDGGTATIPFTYINPASVPKIFRIKDNGISADGTYLKVEGAINGNIQIEVLGLDFRKDSKVYIKDKLATNVEFTSAVVNGVTYDVIIAKVPTAANTDVDLKYPVIVENPDGGLANSTTLDNLTGPNYTPTGGTAIKLPIYFIYRKPLSGPKIEKITPVETSVAANDPAKGLYNWVTITGTDFRAGAMVIIGSRGGVPVSGPDNIVISERGTILKFRVPPNLTLGDKDIQVINPDFGIDTKTNGLKIVSYPTTELSFTDAKGNTMQRLSVEGNQVIRIKGTEFYDGAKVIFGGTRSVKNTTTATSNPFGLWRDDQYYEIQGGIVGAGAKVIDKNTIEVTTPVMKDEGEIVITVINADGGISDGNTKSVVKVPVPSDPIGLKVRLVDETYVELYDYKSEGLDYYEIYYYIGTGEGYKLEEDKYRAFKYLDVTEREPYKILDLPGFEERNVEKDKVWFIIKAVNKFGASNYSNMVYLSPYEIRKLKSVGYPDKDGPMGVPEGKDYVASVKDGMLTVNLSPSKLTNLYVPLGSLNPQKFTLREINIPGSRIPSDNHAITIDFVDSKIGFKPTILNTGSFNTLLDSSKDTTYGKIKTQSVTDQYAAAMKTAIPRGYIPTSKIFQMDFYAVSNTDKQAINTLNGTMSLEISYKDYKLSKTQESNLAAYRYDPTGDKWVKVAFSVNKTSDMVIVKVPGTGAYMLLSTR